MSFLGTYSSASIRGWSANVQAYLEPIQTNGYFNSIAKNRQTIIAVDGLNGGRLISYNNGITWNNQSFPAGFDDSQPYGPGFIYSGRRLQSFPRGDVPRITIEPTINGTLSDQTLYQGSSPTTSLPVYGVLYNIDAANRIAWGVRNLGPTSLSSNPMIAAFNSSTNNWQLSFYSTTSGGYHAPYVGGTQLVLIGNTRWIRGSALYNTTAVSGSGALQDRIFYKGYTFVCGNDGTFWRISGTRQVLNNLPNNVDFYDLNFTSNYLFAFGTLGDIYYSSDLGLSFNRLQIANNFRSPIVFDTLVESDNSILLGSASGFYRLHLNIT